MTAAASAFARVVKPVTDNIPQAGVKFNAETEKFSVFLTISCVPLELQHRRNASDRNPDPDTRCKRGDCNHRNHFTTCKIITTNTTSITNEKRELIICSI